MAHAATMGGVGGVALGCLMAVVTASAQTCSTQAAMPPDVRQGLADAALMLGSAVKAGDLVVLKGATIAVFAGNFSGIEHAVRETGPNLSGDSLHVTQVYALDNSSAKPGEVDFSCPLKGTVAEVDFSFQNLPAGQYGFAMVEAAGGARPWLLSFLLQKDGADWKMAGFYPHAREAAGDNGLWYWNAARDRVKAKQPWLAWLYYNEADALLRPADFVTSSQLDRLRAEQRGAAPTALSDGISVQTPLVVKGKDDAEFHFTSMGSETANDDLSLHLVLHYATDATATADAAKSQNDAAARAMILAHPELRQGYSAVIIFADTPGQAPSVLSVQMADIK